MAPITQPVYVSKKVNPSAGPPNGANMNFTQEMKKSDEIAPQAIIVRLTFDAVS